MPFKPRKTQPKAENSLVCKGQALCRMNTISSENNSMYLQVYVMNPLLSMDGRAEK